MIARTDYNTVLSENSDAMKVARVLCIFFMVYVHTHLFYHEGFQSTGYFLGLRSVLAELLGRSSVPLLSALSGFLMLGYFARHQFKAATQKRAIILLIPLVVWNMLGLLLAFARGKGLDVSVNDVFPLWSRSFYLQLDFLRDVFVVSAATPLLVWLFKRFRIYGLLCLLGLVCVVDLWPVLLRDQILAYYAIGVFIGMYRLNLTRYIPAIRTASSAAFAALFIVILVEALTGKALYSMLPAEIFDNGLRRPIGALTFWFAAVAIARHRRVTDFLVKHIEPAVFLLFLSHIMMIGALGSVYASLQGLHNAPVYTLVWVSLPLACLGMAILCAKLTLYLPRFMAVAVAGKQT